MGLVIEDIINVNVTLSPDKTQATVDWTSGQPGSYGILSYAQGVPNDDTLNYFPLTLGPVSPAQDRFTMTVPGLNPTLPYIFYVKTVLVDGITVVAEMAEAQYLLNPIAPSGVQPVSGGFPIAGPIGLGCDQAINLAQGTIPNVSDVIDDWMQNLVFEKVGKLVSGGTAFQAVETTVQMPFRGLIVPEKSWELALKPYGQRSWKFWRLYAETALQLFTDDVVLWNGVQTRVTGVNDYSLFGLMSYELAQDWTSKGPIS